MEATNVTPIPFSDFLDMVVEGHSAVENHDDAKDLLVSVVCGLIEMEITGLPVPLAPQVLAEELGIDPAQVLRGVELVETSEVDHDVVKQMAPHLFSHLASMGFTVDEDGRATAPGRAND